MGRQVAQRTKGPGRAPIRAAAFAIVALATSAAGAFQLIGSVGKVVDGDTFWLCDSSACHKIRICGINTPEAGMPNYREAREALHSLISDQQVRCVQVGHGTPCDGRSKPTNRDRIVAQCFAGDRDVAAELVSTGMACDWTIFSAGHYTPAGSGKRCSN